MPRRRHAQGRPGTRVIPVAWGADHAPVVARASNATVTIRERAEAPETPVLNPDYTVSEPINPAEPLHTGTARIQQLNGQELVQLVGDQEQVTAGYLVTIAYDAPDIPLYALVQVDESTDPRLGGLRRLIVRRVGSGTERFERDLWCVDDMTREAVDPDDE
jgi:hypothetical protein